jgi:ABC-type Mn2+/Zn2+ transport system permease subunit
LIRDFLDSWALFGSTYLVGWLVCATLSLVGVLMVARNQIFAGAALSQASTLGIAAAMWVGAVLGGDSHRWLESDAFLTGTAVVVSVIASVLTGRTAGRRRESREAVMAWLFLLGASGSVVMVSHSPHGLEEVQRLLSSSIIGATGHDVALFGVLAVATAVWAAVWWRPLLFWVMDPATAQAAGVRVPAVETGVSLWLGLCVGLSIRTSGMLYTFGCLVLPALIAKALCREVRMMFFVAPLAGVVLALAGFVVANHFDYPPAQLTVAFLCLGLLLAWARSLLRS